MHTTYSRHIALLAIILSTLFLSINSVEAQDLELHLATATHITSHPVREYREDAARLALGHMADGRNLYDISVYIPEETQKNLFNALMSIHQSDNPHAKKVVGFGIHTSPKPYYIGHIKVDCTANTTWTAELDTGATTTSNEKVNDVLKKYDLEINNYNKEENSFTISPRSPVNMSKVAKILSDIDDDIEYTLVPDINEPNHNIRAKQVGNDTWIITFEKRGTNNKEAWSFKVDGTGQVTYLSE